MKRIYIAAAIYAVFLSSRMVSVSPAVNSIEGERLFDKETFGGNGRTCVTCHSVETGTVSPEDAKKRFSENPSDPLFLHDGSDDGQGHGVSRMLNDATILVQVPLPPNVRLADDPEARTVTLRRGIPTSFNTPALDPVLMLDGRQHNLIAQASGAVRDHFQSSATPGKKELQSLAEFEMTNRFFSSLALRRFAYGGPKPRLPEGRTKSEIRGRQFFVDAPFAPPSTAGICAACHSGPMLNETNRFVPAPLAPGSRFQAVLVSELNKANNPVREFIFKNADGSETIVRSPDPGRALLTGNASNPLFDNVNAFKIPTLWGVHRTAPYFHDNSAKTLEDVVEQYGKFFEFITDPDGPGGAEPVLSLSEQDKKDMVAYLKLLK